ncbi:GNAT family N-acetyltransferase [Mariniflexile aquimaris]|uniref:GNAT family N-acetyltransferase n=1 Tax=Mariniflexile aquimaris TaxID=881009 RepID=A0ABW3BYL5_9FLAO
MNFRKGNKNDLEQLKELGVKSWTQFKDELTNDNWNELYKSLNSYETYNDLLEKSECIICENDAGEIIGMAFLIPKGNPTEIYDEKWCHLRFVSVSPEFRGKKIGGILTRMCIEIALKNNEQTMALHTSEIMKSARHIYEKIGFKILKEIKPRLGVRYWLYTLELNEIEEKPTHNTV